MSRAAGASADEPIVVAVPAKGGSLQEVMTRLAERGWVDRNLTDRLLAILRGDKERLKAEEAGGCLSTRAQVFGRLQGYLAEPDPMLRAAMTCLRVDLDFARPLRPARIIFDTLETLVEGRRVVLKGTEHEIAPTYLRKHKVDLSLTGYDAFHNSLMDALHDRAVRNWREFAEQIDARNTDVRVVGSLGLGDYLGHFVLVPEARVAAARALGEVTPDWARGPDDPKLALLRGEELLIDPQYQEVYDAILNGRGMEGVRFRAVTGDLERIAAQSGRYACYICRSGGTVVRTPGLHVLGREIVVSETIVALNRERLDAHPFLGRLVETLALEDTREVEARWRSALRDRLGDRLLLGG